MEGFVQNCNSGTFRNLPYSEPEKNSESCQASMVQRFLRTLCNPDTFKTLAHWEPEEYLEPYQASMM